MQQMNETSTTAREKEIVVKANGQRKPDWKRMALASIVLAAGSTGCITGTQFRSAALPAIEGGIGMILDGVVDGLFAAIQVEPDTNAS